VKGTEPPRKDYPSRGGRTARRARKCSVSLIVEKEITQERMSSTAVSRLIKGRDKASGKS